MDGGNLGTTAGTTGAKVYSAAKMFDCIDWISTTQANVVLGHGGEVMRNLRATIPNTPPEGSALNGILSTRLWTRTRIEEPVYVENCSFIDLRSAANAPGRTFAIMNPNDARAYLVNISNALAHAPNGITGGTTADGPLDMTADRTPLYLGRRITTENGGATQTQFGHSTSDAPRARPQTGSAAIGDATGDRIPYRDLYGTVRGATPSRGAIEPA
jgi:hypothetical protein